jgi:CubicO group peptidase (beta-lactamase class C family)
VPRLPSLPGIPRLPFVPDPLNRVHIPRDLDSVTTVGEEAPDGGTIGVDGVEGIWKAAQAMYRSGVHPAVQVCVRREGEVVLDRAIGHARGNGPDDPKITPKVAATPDTPMTVYSAAKGVTAFVVHKLIEKGFFGLDDPVADYIPGYERNNKGSITIGHVLSHRAGVPNLPKEALSLDYVTDREYLAQVLCDAKPFAEAGKLLAYHAVSGGFILGELVWQATGKDIRQVLAEEFLEPLDFRWTNYGVAPEDTGEVALNYLTGPTTLPPVSTLLTRALGVPLKELVQTTNDDRFLTGIVPAANLVTTANELSRFFEVMRCGGEADGVRVMKTETIRKALEEQSHLEIDFSLGFPTRFSYGLMLGAQVLSLYGRDTQHAFGHLGFTNILGWADPARALSAAILTNGKPILYPELPRFLMLSQKITSASPKVSADEMML